MIVKMSLLICLIALLACSPLGYSQKSCQRPRDPNYEFYGTKTLYNDARKHLSTTDEDYLPKEFDDDSLEKMHKEMEEDYCEPQVLYFIGRHAARYPDSEDIEKYNKDAAKLVEVMRTSGCSGLQEFLEWKSKMKPEQDNLITDLGAKEQEQIAQRLKRIYPDFFDASKTKVDFGVTDKIRTTQTGLEFLKLIENLKNMQNCEPEAVATQTNDAEKANYDVKKTRELPCYKDMLAEYRDKALEFHNECEKIGGENKEQDKLVKRIKNANLLKPIADRVAERLGLENSVEQPNVTSGMVDSIYNMCKYENAIKGESIWCGLFDKTDIEAFEYIEDVKNYIKGAYGEDANPRQACPIVKSMLDNFHESVNANGKGDKKSFFEFTHAVPMKKLVAAFGMFKDENSFTDSQIDYFERDMRVPKSRNWRTSFIVPFSSNIVLTLYKCQKPNKPIKFKILTALNEQAVKLAGCDDEDCKARKFFEAYDSFSNCNLDEICRKG